MGLIQDEKKLADEKALNFDIKVFHNKNLVVLSPENVALAEAMIRNDSDYIKMSRNDAKPGKGFEESESKAYQGSAAFWFTQLKYLCEGKECEYSAEQTIQYAVNAVDRENSTHLNSDGVGREEIAKRILCKYKRGELVELLKNTDKNYDLFQEIERKTNPKESTKHARTNTSFASKFCHYASFVLFEGDEEQDGYSIWDRILRIMLPYYLDFYRINKEYDLCQYKQYQEAIDAVRNKAKQEIGKEISRNGFDHLIWYYYKGRLEDYLPSKGKKDEI